MTPMRTKHSGHVEIDGYLPDRHDESEPDVVIGFDWADAEPMTRDYPGSDGGVWVTDVELQDGSQLDVETMDPDLYVHLREQCEQHMIDRDEADLAAREEKR